MVADGGFAFGVLLAFPVAFVVLLLALLVVSGWLRNRGHAAGAASVVAVIVAAPGGALVVVPFSVPMDEAAAVAFWAAACYPSGVAVRRRKQVVAPAVLLALATVGLGWVFENTVFDVLALAGVGGGLLFAAGYAVTDSVPESSE